MKSPPDSPLPLARDGLLQKLLAQNPIRPILTLLNGDNSWLISIPYARPGPNGKHFVHLLLDPWLTGPQPGPLAGIIIHLTRIATPAYGTMDAIYRLISDIENSAAVGKGGTGEAQVAPKHILDGVIVADGGLDHLVHDTLIQIDRSVPVFCTPEVEFVISSWNHFDTIVRLPDFVPGKDTSWPRGSLKHLPQSLSIFRLPDVHATIGKIHFAVIFAFSGNAAGNGALGDSSSLKEAILYSPHGTACSTIDAAWAARPEETSMAAMLHGLSRTGLPFRSARNTGALSGFKLHDIVEPKYWVRTHDDAQEYWGVLSSIMVYETPTWEEAIAQERKETGVLRAVNPRFVEVGNGMSFIAE